MHKQLLWFASIISVLFISACNPQHQSATKEAVTQAAPVSQPQNSSAVSLHEKDDSVILPANQRVEVVEKTISLKGKDGMTTEFYLPVVKGNTEAAALQKINEQLSVKNLTGETLTDLQAAYVECSCGTVGSSYDVNYNQHVLLDITVFIETSGAYLSGYAKRLTFHTQTGEKLAIFQLLKPESLAELAAQCNRQLQERIKTTLQETASGEEGEWVKELLQDKTFETGHLQNFTLSEEGISFYYDFDFPHAAQGLAPDNAFHFTFAQLKDYIYPNGPLGNRY